MLKVSELCSIAGVSRSGYYNWIASKKIRNQKEKQDKQDFELILEAYKYKGIDLSKCKNYDDVRQIIDDWIYYYNNERYQWNLAKLSPVEYYKYYITGEYPIKMGNTKNNKIPSS